MTLIPNLISPVLALTPAMVTWTPKVGLVMILCNVIAIAIGKATIKYPNEGPGLPNNSFFGGFGLAAMLGTTSLGHIIGIGAIQGLAASGAL
jgi:photosystem I subunit 10